MGVLGEVYTLIHKTAHCMLYTAIACMKVAGGDDSAYLNVCTPRTASCAEWLNGSHYQ